MTTIPAPTVESVQNGKLVETVGGHVVSEKDLAHVLAAYRGTLNSAHTSDDAKKHAEERIKELENVKDNKGPDPKHVIAGLKAALHNDHVHDDVKEDIKLRLKEMGVDKEEIDA